MKRFRILGGVALVALSSVAAAYIHPSASSATLALSISAEDLHNYMHDEYVNCYGAHHLDVTAGILDSVTLDFEQNLATECDVVDARTVVKDGYIDLTAQFQANGIFGDPGALAIYMDITSDLKLVTAYTRSACVPTGGMRSRSLNSGVDKMR